MINSHSMLDRNNSHRSRMSVGRADQTSGDTALPASNATSNPTHAPAVDSRGGSDGSDPWTAVRVPSFLNKNSAVNYFHGSNSASLEPVIRHGLCPFGQLPDGVTFSGTLDFGITPEGVNQLSLSALPPDSLGSVCQYTTNQLQGWSPDISERSTQRLSDARQNTRRDRGILEATLKDHPEQRADNLWLLKHYEQVIKLCETLLEIEQKRMALWPQLSIEQQGLITHPFPVLYGISYDGEGNAVRSEIHGEKAIPAVAPSQLIIFVLAEHIGRVAGMVKAQGSHIPVKSMEDIVQNLPGYSSTYVTRCLELIRTVYARKGGDRSIRMNRV